MTNFYCRNRQRLAYQFCVKIAVCQSLLTPLPAWSPTRCTARTEELFCSRALVAVVELCPWVASSPTANEWAVFTGKLTAEWLNELIWIWEQEFLSQIFWSASVVGSMFLLLLTWGFVFNSILLSFVRQELVLIAQCYLDELLEGELNCCKNTPWKYWITRFFLFFFLMVKCLLLWSQVITLCFHYSMSCTWQWVCYR